MYSDYVIYSPDIPVFRDGVEFCVVGLDRNWAYNPACKAAGP